MIVWTLKQNILLQTVVTFSIHAEVPKAKILYGNEYYLPF